MYQIFLELFPHFDQYDLGRLLYSGPIISKFFKGKGQGLRGFSRILREAFPLGNKGFFAPISSRLEEERSRWVLWIPVALGMGIGLYFSLPFEPALPPLSRLGLFFIAGISLAMGFFSKKTWVSFLAWALFWGLSGFFLSMMRTHRVNPHPLRETTEPLWITGRIEGMDHPASAHTLFQRVILVLEEPQGNNLQRKEKGSWEQSRGFPRDKKHCQRMDCTLQYKYTDNKCGGNGKRTEYRENCYQGKGALSIRGRNNMEDSGRIPWVSSTADALSAHIRVDGSFSGYAFDPRGSCASYAAFPYSSAWFPAPYASAFDSPTFGLCFFHGIRSPSSNPFVTLGRDRVFHASLLMTLGRNPSLSPLLSLNVSGSQPQGPLSTLPLWPSLFSPALPGTNISPSLEASGVVFSPHKGLSLPPLGERGPWGDPTQKAPGPRPEGPLSASSSSPFEDFSAPPPLPNLPSHKRIPAPLPTLPTKTVALPKKVMITIRTASLPLLEGDRIRLKAILTPLPGPCFPGAHDPRQQFFFQGIGASGFALNSPRILSRQPTTLSRWRHTLTRKLHAFLPPPLGAMACGLVTGDKIALPPKVRQEFADSGLAHLLAIAGLHMSILSGLCFMLFQRTLARIPSLALYVNLDRIAALLSLGVGWMYLMISGQRYPVQRAFFMMAASMLGMIVGRRRHSMRILMLCAATFLILQPEALLSLSFQLSFAAVGGLIAVYEGRRAWRYREGWRKPWKKRKFPKVRRFISDSLWSTGSITLMTLPIMIHHFYHVSLQGLLSNMVAIPFTGALVMPLGLGALLSMATPWAEVIMRVWGWSLRGLMEIASLSAGYGSWMIGWFRPHNSLFFALEMLGICWLLLWQGSWRWWGVFLWVLASVGGHVFRLQPALLVDSDHKLVAYVDGRRGTLWVSSLRRGKWAAQRWSQAFGVRNIALWPEDMAACGAAGLPWYMTYGYGSAGDRGAGSWSLVVGRGRVLLLEGDFGPQGGCLMWDGSGNPLGEHGGRRPWRDK